MGVLVGFSTNSKTILETIQPLESPVMTTGSFVIPKNRTEYQFRMNLSSTGLWSEFLKPVSIVFTSSIFTFGESMRPSIV